MPAAKGSHALRFDQNVQCIVMVHAIYQDSSHWHASRVFSPIPSSHPRSSPMLPVGSLAMALSNPELTIVLVMMTLKSLLQY
jgi:hypothetical protein